MKTMLDIRREHFRKEANKDKKTTKEGELPSQYQRRTNLALEDQTPANEDCKLSADSEELDAGNHSDSESLMDIEAMREELTRNVNIDQRRQGKFSLCRTSRSYTVQRAHLEYTRCNFKMSNGCSPIISDSRANSCVLGDVAFHIEATTQRTVTMVGYHGQRSKKQDCPVVTGVGVCTTKEGREFLLVINESVLNKGCNVSLMSEHQVRDNGHSVDSVSRKHMKSETEKGTQSMTLRGSHDQQVVDFRFQSGLAVFPVRKPMEQELTSLRRVELTSTQPWTPENEYSEDGMDLVSPLNNPLANAYEPTLPSSQFKK